MRINDPFGRVSNRNQRNFESLRDRLRQEGILDTAAVGRFTANMTGAALKLLALVFGVSLGLGVLFPHYLVALLALDAMVLLWVASGYFQTRMHLKRYLREECNTG